MRVALSVIATGKYTRFLCGLLGTAHEFFCPGHDVRILVFSDSAVPKHHQNTIVIPTPHEPWPGPTLHRYRTMLRAADTLEGCDYVYYLDVDSRFVRPVGEEVFGDLAATVHYGFCEAPRRAVDLRDAVCEPGPRRSRGARQALLLRRVSGRPRGHLPCGHAVDGRGDRRRRAPRHHGLLARREPLEPLSNRSPAHVELSHDYMCPEPWRPRHAADRDRGQEQRGNETALATEEFGHGLNIDPEYRAPRNTDLNSKN